MIRFLLNSCVVWFLVVASINAEPLRFAVTFTEKVTTQPFSGRVYVVLSRSPIVGISGGVNWFRPEPVFAKDVTNVKPGETVILDTKALGYPYKLDKLPDARYYIQAILDLDRGGRSFTRSPGNGYSDVVRKELSPKSSGTVSLTIDKVYTPSPFQETERVKEIVVDSPLLTKFHGNPMVMKAGVVLPKSFHDQPNKRYPIVYEIPGFGGTHTGAFSRARGNFTDVDGVEMLWVVLDPSCRLGHHVFADSANNGPRGEALVTELIPAIEKRFRGIGKPYARLLTGHSSGGWSSLWLQVTYPEFFGGVWSTAPDPVDLRDFQRINIYRRGENMFVDADGNRRPLARSGDRPLLYFKPFSDMEVVMGRGGQLASFEAVFSERNRDGGPRKLWNRDTGEIDIDVAKSWEKYDIRLVLQRNWEKLAPHLKGKIHVYMGDVDTFYLDGAVRLLKTQMEKLGSDAVVEMFPGKNHGNLLDSKLRERISKEMADTVRRGEKQTSAPRR